MEAVARITAKGQVTVPKSVRDALGVGEGDSLVFRVEGDHAVLSPTRDLLELAGSVSVPVDKRSTPWREARRQAWRSRGQSLR